MAEENKVENIASSFEDFMNGLGKTEEERDKNGNLLSSKTLDGNGNVLYSFVYTYDESGRQTSKTTFDKDGKAEKRVESTYDENGFRTTRRFDKDNELTSENRYDDKGREVASLSYYNGEMRQISSYSYKENGDVEQEVRYEMRNGKMRIAEQAFYDDALTRHSRRYGADGSVNLEYQPKGASFPYGVSEPTKDDYARDAERAEENLKNYQAEAAFYNDKPAPVKDAWIASFEPKTAEEPAKEEPVKETVAQSEQSEPEKQSKTRDRQFTDSEGFAHTVSYDDDGRVVANKKFDERGNLIGEGIYENGEFKGTKEYSESIVGDKTVVVRDTQDRVVSDQTFDRKGNLRREGLYENGEHVGARTYTELGGRMRIVTTDNDFMTVSDQTFDKNGNLINEGIIQDGIVTGSNEYYTDDEGFKHVFESDAHDYPVSDRKLDSDGKLLEERLYDNGTYAGRREYSVVDGVEQVVEYDANDNVKTPEPEKQAETTLENTIQNGDEPKAEENTIQNGAEPMTEENTIQNGDEQVETVYENNSNEKQYIDAEGYSHSVRYDDNGRVTADLKYGQDGKLAGQDLYRDGERMGTVEYAYGQDGSKSIYRYDAQGVQTRYDSYDANGRHVYTSDFRDGNPKTSVAFDEEGRPETIYRFVQGTNAISTNISYDGDSVYKTVHSPDGQLLRTETTRDGVLSVVDYVSKTAKMTSFDDEGRVQSCVGYEIQGEELIKTDDTVYTYEGAEVRQVQSRTYENGRMTEAYTGLPWGDGNDTTYYFEQDGSYTESTADKTKKHSAVKLFGKTLRTPEQPEFKENPLENMPFVGVDTSVKPQISEEERESYRKHYGAAWNNYVLLDAATVKKDVFTSEGIWFADRGEYGRQQDKELLDKTDEKFVRNEAVMDTAENILPEPQPKRQSEQNDVEEQPVQDTEQKDKEENAEQHGEKQTQDDTRSHDEEVLQNDVEDLGWDNADNQTLDAETCAAENADEKTGRGLGESDLMQQNKNLQQWINYFGMEGSRAKPPYASPFEKISGCRDLKGLAMLDLESGNSLINSKNRIELIVRNEDGQKKEPTLEECMTLVRLGQQKGWTSIRISGSAAFQKQMYLACRSLGMPTKDFIPTPEMLKEGDALDAAHNSKDNLLKQSAEDKEAGKPEMRLPTLTERCADLDNRFYALEKVRKAQPERKKTAEDPHPELANFDTIRAAEKQGIRPLNAVEKEPDDLDGKVKVLHKRTNDALNELMESEQKHKGALFNSAAAEQRSEWRKELIAVQEKEVNGQPLTDADKHVQAMASKYKINADPKKEPDKVPPINRKDFDEKTEKALRKKEIGVEAGTAYAAAVVRREAAANAAGLIASGKSDLKTAKDLVNTAKQELKTNAANRPPISEVVRQIGQINAQTVSQTAQNKKNYRDVTGHAMPERRANSEASRKLDARVLAASQNRNR